MTYLLIAARMLVGGLLLVAAVAKALAGGRRRFAAEIAAYEIIPEQLTTFAAALLIPAEATIGLALISGVAVPIPSLVAALMFLAFSVAVASALSRGLNISCGCFGTRSKAVSPFVVVRNVALTVLALASSWAPSAFGSGPGTVATDGIHQYGIAAGVAAAGVVVILLGRAIADLFSIHKATLEAHEALGLRKIQELRDARAEAIEVNGLR